MTTDSQTVYWSAKFQTFVFEGAVDHEKQRVEIFEVGTARFLGWQTTDDEWQGD